MFLKKTPYVLLYRCLGPFAKRAGADDLGFSVWGVGFRAVFWTAYYKESRVFAFGGLGERGPFLTLNPTSGSLYLEAE